MKKIIVATDFSPAALNASNYAADMALALNAELTLLHIYQVPVLVFDASVLAPVNQEEIEDTAKTSMNTLKEELLKRTGGKLVIDQRIVMGVFYEELERLCNELQPYFVIMGSQGTTAAERLFLGGHVVHAMKHLHWPLISVPPNAAYTGIKKIGLACDFNKIIETTPVNSIKKLVDDLKAELHILNSGKEKEFSPDVVFGSGLLQEMVYAYKPRYHFITNHSSVEGIMELAQEHAIDLLIVLPKEHTIMEMITHKSVSKKLVLKSHVPVLSLHV